MSGAIRNCEFAFKCPKSWDSLERTAVSTERYCGECQRNVYFCSTPQELESAIVKNLCVAVAVPTSDKKTELQTDLDPHDAIVYIGEVAPAYLP